MGDERRWLRVMLVVCVLGTAIMALPWAGVIVLAAWFGKLAQPPMLWLARLLGGRRGAAALVTLLACLLVITPLVIVITVSAATAVDLIQKAQHTVMGGQLLDEVGRSAKDSGVRAVQAIGRGATRVVLAIALFVVGAYTCLVDGERAWAWIGERVPLRPAVRARLAAAFHECGSGLLVGMMLTALLQGTVATCVYLGLGVPHALILGGLTFLGAFVPLIGTASVWAPVAVGLFLSGRHGAALALVAMGLLLIGTVDNLMRPYFARFGKLDLPTWVVALSMFGGLELFGFQGLVLGPVFVRLSLELLGLAREADLERPRAEEPPAAAPKSAPRPQIADGVDGR